MFDSILAKADFVGTNAEMPYTVLIGILAVFTGLICIVLLCKLIGLSNKKTKKDKKTEAAVTSAPQVQASAPIENRQQIIAAVSAAVAEELGTDVSAIRILSFKKI